jgi:hypothetical protein
VELAIIFRDKYIKIFTVIKIFYDYDDNYSFLLLLGDSHHNRYFVLFCTIYLNFMPVCKVGMILLFPGD